MTYQQLINSRLYYALLGLVLFVYLFVIVIGKQLGPYQLLVVKSGSMEPILPEQALILVRKRSEYDLQDMVTYQRYVIESDESETVTHRIVDKRRNQETVFYLLQGDQNQVVDGWIRQSRVVGKVTAVMPLFGQIVTLFRSRLGKIVLVAGPVLFFSTSELFKIKQELKNS